MATPLLTLVPTAADPILAAIAAHRDAWRDFANATPESVTETALAQRTAMADMLGTACTTRTGADALFRHLRACLAAGGRNLDLGTIGRSLITARAFDLALLLDIPGARAPLAADPETSAAVHALNRAGEAVAALVLIAGGIALTGLATLL